MWHIYWEYFYLSGVFYSAISFMYWLGNHNQATQEKRKLSWFRLIFKDFSAGLRNFFGGRSGAYEGELVQARQKAIEEMTQRAAALGANAVVGVDIDYEAMGQNGNMLMVTASGTAVILE